MKALRLQKIEMTHVIKKMCVLACWKTKYMLICYVVKPFPADASPDKLRARLEDALDTLS